jgi:uncharacterized membrane protein YqjE
VITIAVVTLFPPENRGIAISGFGLLYLIVAIVVALKLRSEVRNAPPPLNDTLCELKKDLHSLRSRNDSHS